MVSIGNPYHGDEQFLIHVTTGHRWCHSMSQQISWDIAFMTSTIELFSYFCVVPNNKELFCILKTLFARETCYLTQKCEMSPSYLPNLSFKKDWTAALQPQQLSAWLIGQSYLKFKFKSISKSQILISFSHPEIYPKNAWFNMVRGR